MAKTNKGLVEYAKLQLGKPYWYGTYGQKATKQLYNSKKKQYSAYYQWSYSNSVAGKRVHDCVGLIKGYLWSATPTSSPKYNKNQDVSADGMYTTGCNKKGNINSMPNTIGVLVFKSGHVGVYIGGGYVIEAKGHAYGVVKTKLAGGGWTKWGMCKWIEYSAQSSAPSATQYYKKYSGTSTSIVDCLKAVGEKDTSYNHRKKIAKANGINNYIGSASQNLKLVKMLKLGKLKKA